MLKEPPCNTRSLCRSGRTPVDESAFLPAMRLPFRNGSMLAKGQQKPTVLANGVLRSRFRVGLPGLAEGPQRLPVPPRNFGVPRRRFGVLKRGLGLLPRSFWVPRKAFRVPRSGFGVPQRAFEVPRRSFGVLRRGFGVLRRSFWLPQSESGVLQSGLGEPHTNEALDESLQGERRRPEWVRLAESI